MRRPTTSKQNTLVTQNTNQSFNGIPRKPKVPHIHLPGSITTHQQDSDEVRNHQIEENKESILMELPSISMGVANLSLRHDMFINEVKGTKG